MLLPGRFTRSHTRLAWRETRTVRVPFPLICFRQLGRPYRRMATASGAASTSFALLCSTPPPSFSVATPASKLVVVDSTSTAFAKYASAFRFTIPSKFILGSATQPFVRLWIRQPTSHSDYPPNNAPSLLFPDEFREIQIHLCRNFFSASAPPNNYPIRSPLLRSLILPLRFLI